MAFSPWLGNGENNEGGMTSIDDALRLAGLAAKFPPRPRGLEGVSPLDIVRDALARVGRADIEMSPNAAGVYEMQQDRF